jgi:long-chain acyl-CoA synthetase
LQAWVGDLFAAILSEAYGSTEAGRISTMPFARRAEKPGSCGRPVRGVTVEIRDERGQRLPAGTIGEIWARTQRSLECDLPDASPRARRDADGYVATGDAGRVDEDGFIYITGKATSLPEPDMRHAG